MKFTNGYWMIRDGVDASTLVKPTNWRRMPPPKASTSSPRPPWCAADTIP